MNAFRFSLLKPIAWLIGCWMMALPARAQTEGIGLWTGLAADYRLSKKFTLNLNGQVRFSDNIQVTRAYLGEAGLSYKLTKRWEVSGYYRYIGRLKKNKETDAYYYRPYHRFYGEASYDQKLGKGFRMGYRLRYQHQFRDDAEGVIATGSYLRNKLELEWRNTSVVTPFVSADVFYRVGGPVDRKTVVGRGFDQVRYRGGLQLRFAKAHGIDLFAQQDKAIRGSGEGSGLVLGAVYKLKLGRGKTKAADKSDKRDE